MIGIRESNELQDALARAIAAGDSQRAMQALAHLLTVVLDSQAAFERTLRLLHDQLTDVRKVQNLGCDARVAWAQRSMEILQHPPTSVMLMRGMNPDGQDCYLAEAVWIGGEQARHIVAYGATWTEALCALASTLMIKDGR